MIELRDVTVDGAVAARAMELLDRREDAIGAPLVDESERRRLEAMHRDGSAEDGWHAHLAVAGGQVAGYAGGSMAGGRLAADLLVVEDETAAAATDALVERLRVVTDVAGADLLVWVRAATDADVRRAEAAGLVVHRRLEVLGRELDELPDPAAEGATIRSFRRGEDDEAVTRVLREAYRGTPDGGWDVATFRSRTRLPWFRPEDLLLAVDADGEVVGIHWLKRRGHRVGEVHNLAVHPDAHGQGLGPQLLHAGLRHLEQVGCERVILWVDADNDRAMAVYRRAGFVPLWADVAFEDAG